jgi:hypothetical protein
VPLGAARKTRGAMIFFLRVIPDCRQRQIRDP